jgi:hypothetical protein
VRFWFLIVFMRAFLYDENGDGENEIALGEPVGQVSSPNTTKHN